MLFLIKFFPEIAVKSRVVRKQFTQQLRKNISRVLTAIDPDIVVKNEWDHLTVSTSLCDQDKFNEIRFTLTHTPGVSRIHDVSGYPLPSVDEIIDLAVAEYKDSVEGKAFAVRCKRAGQHGFSSVDIERRVGEKLLQTVASASVNLSEPEVVVAIEIRNDKLYLLTNSVPGMGGFPLGSLDSAVSLISGGFDSSVSSYLCIKRGIQTHYCFFNLGGSAHEAAVKEIALYLWSTFHTSHRVKFVTVPFEPVVNEIVSKVDNAYMGVVLKCMMMKTASAIAESLHIDALVTGEAVAQVSSQTLKNLKAIDEAADTLVMRPLIHSDKQSIIDLSREIGTEQFSKGVPEYCAVISKNPTTKAKPDKLEWELSRIESSVLEDALANANYQNITDLKEDLSQPNAEISVTGQIQPGEVVIDIRHPEEAEDQPLKLPLPEAEIVQLPFYKLGNGFERLDQSKQYLLHCDKGTMSRIHAAYLYEAGYKNIAVLDLSLKS